MFLNSIYFITLPKVRCNVKLGSSTRKFTVSDYTSIQLATQAAVKFQAITSRMVIQCEDCKGKDTMLELSHYQVSF